jgi:hypothetical protein
VTSVATKALLAKEERVQLRDLPLGGYFGLQTPAHRLAELGQLIEIRLDIQAQVLLAGNQQRRARQVDLALVSGDQSL